MPFRRYPDFDPDTLRLMTAVYDAIVTRLAIGQDDPRTSRLAIAIVNLAREGLHDKAKLIDQALVELNASSGKRRKRKLHESI